MTWWAPREGTRVVVVTFSVLASFVRSVDRLVLLHRLVVGVIGADRVPVLGHFVVDFVRKFICLTTCTIKVQSLCQHRLVWSSILNVLMIAKESANARPISYIGCETCKLR